MSGIHVYSLCWNEMEMLPFFLRHYRDLGAKFYIFDDASTDGSAEYLAAQPDVELGSFTKDADSFVAAAQRFYNECWKRSRGEADWVIVCNVDEHLYHPDLYEYLDQQRRRGVTIIPSAGFQMVSDAFPQSGTWLVSGVRCGMPHDVMDKLSIFDPGAIDEINYSPGRHKAAPSGRVVAPDASEVKLLHYKYLGLQYYARRLAELRLGLRAKDIEKGWGAHYLRETGEIKRDFANVRSRAIEVVRRAQKMRARVDAIEGVRIVPLKRIDNERGHLMEVQRRDDSHYLGFGQVYVTSTRAGVVKAWYRHREQSDQIAVISGAITLVLYDGRSNTATSGGLQIIQMSGLAPTLVQFPPGIWHGFVATGGADATLLHLNSEPFRHKAPDEDRLASDFALIPYRW